MRLRAVVWGFQAIMRRIAVGYHRLAAIADQEERAALVAAPLMGDPSPETGFA